MYFHIKRLIGEFLYDIGYLAEMTVEYIPKKKVYFGRTMRQWKGDENFRRNNPLVRRKK